MLTFDSFFFVVVQDAHADREGNRSGVGEGCFAHAVSDTGNGTSVRVLMLSQIKHHRLSLNRPELCRYDDRCCDVTNPFFFFFFFLSNTVISPRLGDLLALALLHLHHQAGAVCWVFFLAVFSVFQIG